MKKAKLFLSAFSAFVTLCAFAQDREVYGVITDASSGEGVPFASVMVSGTMNGVSSDADGIYSINAPSDAVLKFSAIGYEELEVEINGRTEVNVEMTPDTEVLEETVVIGYGSAKSVEHLVGSVQTVNSETLKNAPSSSALDQLQGQVAGLQVLTMSGVAGDNAVSMTLHGVGSLNSSTTPLYVIDGIPSSSRAIMAGRGRHFNLRFTCRQRRRLRDHQGRFLQRGRFCDSALSVRNLHPGEHEALQQHDERLRAHGLLGEVRPPQRVLGKDQLYRQGLHP